MNSKVIFRILAEEKKQLAECDSDGNISFAARKAARLLIQAQKSKKQ